RQRLVHFLLRHEIRPPQGVKNWTVKYRTWLNTLTFEKTSLRIVFQEYLHSIYEVEERMKRIEAQIHEEAIKSEHAPVIQALQTLRGIAEITAVTLVAEVGQFSRFSNPRQRLMQDLFRKNIPVDQTVGKVPLPKLEIHISDVL
ncbi:transposase, partial [Gottfriedia acidiceleris]